MKGLIIKDLYVNKKGLIIAVIFITVYSFLFVRTTGLGFIIGFSIVMFSAFPIKSFSFDEYCHWDRYAVSMPVKRADLVKAKFVGMIVFAAFGMLFGVLVAVVYMILAQAFNLPLENENLLGIVGQAYFIFLYALTCESIGLVTVYKFGSAFNWLIFPICFLVPVILVYAVNEVLNYFGISIPISLGGLCLTLTVLAPLVVYGSYKVSCWIFQKKDI